MIEVQPRRVLTPSFSRAFVRVFLTTLAVIPLGALVQRWQTGHWWGLGYCLSLPISVAIFSLVVCIGFVPLCVEWSTTEFFIRTRARTGSFSWEQLYAYGPAQGVFLLQFSGTATFQIYVGAFEPAEWQALSQFLATTYPSKRSRLWIGPFSVRRGA